MATHPKVNIATLQFSRQKQANQGKELQAEFCPHHYRTADRFFLLCGNMLPTRRDRSGPTWKRCGWKSCSFWARCFRQGDRAKFIGSIDACAVQL
jgi:hypothetical protein